MGARTDNGVSFLVRTAEVASFTVEGTAKSLGWVEDRADVLMDSAAPVFIPYEWKHPDGRTFSVDPKWVKPYEKMFPNSED
jgi:hypothetical protein